MSTPFAQFPSAIAPSGFVRVYSTAPNYTTQQVVYTFACVGTGAQYTATVPGNNPEVSPALWMAAREANEEAKRQGVV